MATTSTPSVALKLPSSRTALGIWAARSSR